MKKKEINSIKLPRLTIIVVILLFLCIAIRLSFLALSTEVEGINIQVFANNRITRTETLTAKRGSIYDVKGNILVQNVSSYTLIAYLSPSRTTNVNYPQHVVDKEYTAKMLAPVLDISEEKILYHLSKSNLYQTEFGSKGKGLTELKKDEILALNLPGIDFIETQKRYYPYGDFASYTLGYAVERTLSDGTTNIVGEMGVESFYNKYLTGTDGYRYYQKDRNGYKIAGTNELVVDATNGYDVYLTIDTNIQLFVERAIKEAEQNYKFDWMSMVVADAKTGSILASSSSPSFDPNIRNMTNYLNYNISYPFEPGSTMKIFTYMAAMENGTYDGNEKYKSGSFTAKDGTIMRDSNKVGWGILTYDQGFAISSNTAVMNLIDKYMSGDYLKEYFLKLGFGSKTGIELPGEVSGKINFKYETEILNAGFGQGISVTPMQNIKALTSISNNGVLLKPYIIDKIVNPNTNEVVYEGKRTELERVASEETIKKIKDLMYTVVNGSAASSTGVVYKMDGYDIIAKTGTAQIANQYGTGYTEGVTVGFAGMFPKDDPEIIIYIAAQNPNKGSGTTSYVVKQVIKNLSNYLNIFDEKTDEVITAVRYEMGSYLNNDVAGVSKLLKDNGLDVSVIGDGDKIIGQYPEKGSVISSTNKVFLISNGSKKTMPNLVGYSVKDAKTYLDLLGVSYNISGNGYVVKQSIKKDTVITNDLEIELTCNLKNNVNTSKK